MSTDISNETADGLWRRYEAAIGIRGDRVRGPGWGGAGAGRGPGADRVAVLPDHPVSGGGHAEQPRSRGREYTFSTSTDCPGLPSTAGGWAIHISFLPTTVASFLTIYPSGVTRPGTSTLLGYPGTYTGNNAIVPAGSGGTIELYSQYAGTVIIDVNGYFAP